MCRVICMLTNWPATTLFKCHAIIKYQWFLFTHSCYYVGSAKKFVDSVTCACTQFSLMSLIILRLQPKYTSYYHQGLKNILQEMRYEFQHGLNGKSTSVLGNQIASLISVLIQSHFFHFFIMSLFTLVSIMQVLAKTGKSKCKSWPRRASLNASLGQDLARLKHVKNSKKTSEMAEKTSKIAPKNV